MIVAVIPAKKESKRLPNKNMLKIKDKSLVELSIDYAKKNKKIKKIIVSTNSDLIARHARGLGAEVILRGHELCGDTPLIEVYRHVWTQLNDKRITHMVGIQPDHPDRKIDLDAAISYSLSKNIDDLFTVDRYGKKNGSLRILSVKALETRPPVYASSIQDDCINIHTLFDFHMAKRSLLMKDDSIKVDNRRICKVTVYIPTYNYAHYIEKSIQSALKQTMTDWELIIIDDGSTDNTQEILTKYRNHPKIRIIEQENKGLNVTNNIALHLANGKYIMRLDADDYLDENALLILSNVLDTKPDMGLVYPDYYEVDSDGEVINLVRQKKLKEEVELLDLPAHGACTMFRKELLIDIGGYRETFFCQDGYELWLRFIQKHHPYNINLPLFYYRKHPSSLTSNQKNILETRRKIKRHFVKERYSGQIPKVLGFIPVTRRSVYAQNDPFVKLAGKPLIWYTLNELKSVSSLDRIIISSEDDEVLEYAKGFLGMEVIKRSTEFLRSTLKMKDLIRYVLNQLESTSGYKPDAVCTLYINTPLRQSYHIDKAVDTMVIFDVDSVISVQEELFHCYHHKRYGLEPINIMDGGVRIERRSIYKENSAIYLNKINVIQSGHFLGKKIGHILMLPEESIKINSEYDLWLAEKILKERWKKG